MSSIEDHYPQSCPFCTISQTYPPSPSTPIPSSPDPELLSPQCHLLLSTPHILAFLDILPMSPGHILLTTRTHYQTLTDLYPQATSSPSSQLWQDNKRHADAREAAQALGEYMPILSRALCLVTGVEDWNIVQNNGARAAQVVPHVHFHFIPRYQEGRDPRDGKGRGGAGGEWEKMKSWRMFGRGSREDLDDGEGKEMAGRLREALREVMGEKNSEGKGVKAKL